MFENKMFNNKINKNRIILSKKSQIKMFENVGVMIVFFFLLSFGLIFYTRYQKYSINSEIREGNVKNMIQTSRRIFYMPEIQCSQSASDNCIDIYKFKAFVSVMGDELAKKYYYNIFEKSVVSLETIYPEQSVDVLYKDIIPLKNRPRIVKTIVPVPVYDPIKKINGYGVLNVTVYVPSR